MKYSALCLRILPVIALTALAAPRIAEAQMTPVSPTGSDIIAGSTVPWVPMAEWERPNGMSSIAAGDKEIAQAPPDATKYRAKTFTFPTGSIRVLEFKKSDGGVLHNVTFETEMYVLQGATDVGVRGTIQSLVAGDAVNLPSGFLRSKPDNAEDTTVMLFTVDSAASSPASVVVRGGNAKETSRPAAEGEPSVSVKSYPFDGNSIRIAVSKAPGVSKPYLGKVDAILYMLSGRMQITIGNEVKIVQAGDALREPAGLPSNWDVLEDSVFIATSAPFNPKPPR